MEDQNLFADISTVTNFKFQVYDTIENYEAFCQKSIEIIFYNRYVNSIRERSQLYRYF